MATRTTPFAAGTPCWVDLFSSDVSKAKQFYGDVLGWTSEDSGTEYGGYVNFFSDGHRVAGMMANQMEGMPDGWNTYISTDDLAATLAKATEAGGQVVMPATEVGELGSMAMIIDPARAAIGVWQPGQHTGFGKYNEPGGVTWDELHTNDFAASTRFYQDVFGWQLEVTSDTDEFRYVTGQVNGESVAGVMDAHSYLPADQPSAWTLYFSVADIDAASEKVTAGGGRVIRPAENTPFGRIGEFADPTGALFKLHSEMAG
jgi:uncharacterized protein